MARDKSRKAPLRKRPRTLDPGLIQIAELLDEQRLETNARGWLTMPWRDGRCAAMLASYTGYRVAWKQPQSLMVENIVTLAMTRSYWEIEDRAAMLTPTERFHRAGLRCLQVRAANSAGGGHVYNDILSRIDDDLNEDDVIEWRSRDALSLGIHHVEDAWGAREREVFKLAWRRGLFRTAYALKGPVSLTM